MLLLLLILIIPYVSSNTISPTNEAIDYRLKLNELRYSHNSTVTGDKAQFNFKLSNAEEFGIYSHYYSITFIEEHPHEAQIEGKNITNTAEYEDQLAMEGLEEEGNYFVCVIFLNTSQHVISSSRFCHVVSVSDNCQLKTAEKTFSNRHVLILVIFVIVLLTVTVLFTCIRAYIYRPKTIEALLKTLPGHHAENLETLAPVAADRRRRQTQPALGNRLREDSVLSANYQPGTDDDFNDYHAYDNRLLDVIVE